MTAMIPTAFEWMVIEPQLPSKWLGVPRVDEKRVLNGVFCVARSGLMSLPTKEVA